METKSLLYGLIGFFVGGLLVATAATTFDKPTAESGNNPSMHASMANMSASLDGKTGDEFDKAFLKEMIVHHQGAVTMAKQAQQNAKHQEIRNLADAIVAAQNTEISDMRLWQTQWGYIDGSIESMVH